MAVWSGRNAFWMDVGFFFPIFRATHCLSACMAHSRSTGTATIIVDQRILTILTQHTLISPKRNIEEKKIGEFETNKFVFGALVRWPIWREINKM